MFKKLGFILAVFALLFSGCSDGDGDSLPELRDVGVDQSYTKNQEIASRDFINTGKGNLRACVASPQLPIGLSIGRSLDNDTCRLSGTASKTKTKTVYTITAINGGGSDSATITISVLEADVDNTDTTKPVITLTGGSTALTVGDSYTPPTAKATDNADGDIASSVVQSGDTVDTDTAGTYVVKYDVTDEAGNKADTETHAVVVSVVADTSKPIITLTGGSTALTVGDSYTPPTVQATDNEDGNITDDIVESGTVDTDTAGTYVVKYDVTDSAGNKADTKLYTVVVSETTQPLAIPDLDDFDDFKDQVYNVDKKITLIRFVNNGGGSLTGCSIDINESDKPELPAGLKLRVSEDNNTCEIFGTPTTVANDDGEGDSINYEVLASNASGSASVSATIFVEVVPENNPILHQLDDKSYPVDVEIDTLIFENVGVGDLQTCEPDKDGLPEGLKVRVSEDKTTCEIYGTPSKVIESFTYGIGGTNETGTSLGLVKIKIVRG